MNTIRKGFFPLIFSMFLIWGTWGNAQAAPAVSVGYVDFIQLIQQHPDTAQANAVLKAEQEALKKEFETKSAGLSEQDKRELDRQLRQRLEQKRLELVKPISAKVVAAANEVAKEKELSIVIGKNEVVCGGVDITADVLKRITGK